MFPTSLSVTNTHTHSLALSLSLSLSFCLSVCLSVSLSLCLLAFPFAPLPRLSQPILYFLVFPSHFLSLVITSIFLSCSLCPSPSSCQPFPLSFSLSLPPSESLFFSRSLSHPTWSAPLVSPGLNGGGRLLTLLTKSLKKSCSLPGSEWEITEAFPFSLPKLKSQRPQWSAYWELTT